jgi:pilus assembly protein CpaC
MLMVTVAEVNRTAARSIGMDFSITKGKFAFAQVSGNLLNTTGTTASGSVASGVAGLGGNLPTSIDNGSVLLAINALRTQNFARTLAEPNLTTINGKSASFHAGGSFPVPQTNVFTGGAASEVVYIPFGVQLQFVPYVTDRDRVRLEIQAAVSTRSATTTAVAGSTVPSELDDRTFQTTVDLREGQTLAVAGLISTNFGGTSNRVPFFGDLPLIGRLAGFDQLSSGEQELVVLVTPVLVHPLERCQTPNLPGSDVFEPGDVEFYLGGHLEGLRSEDFRAGVRTDFARQEAYCNCEDVYIIGPKGPTFTCCCGSGACPNHAPSQAVALPTKEQ